MSQTMADWDVQKKALLPYLQRAAEIEAVDPKVAYYCRLYAVEQGIKLEHRDQRAEDLLELVLNQLEKDKPHLVLDTTVDLEHCERFALNVYVKAKRRDEQGNSDRDTAKAYYAAFNFIEILKQFGPLSAEVEKERRFAVFRAAEIKRCLDEGKDPPVLVPSASNDVNNVVTEPTLSQNQGGPPLSERAIDTFSLREWRHHGCHLVDYDPGYVIGSKILFMDGESRLLRKGFISGKAPEVGGFFNIESEDGSERQLGALFLAPDLAEGDEVTYFFPDGRQLQGSITEMHAAEWPPTYDLKLEDDTICTVTHSQFVLNSDPITAEESRTLDEALVDAVMESTTSITATPEPSGEAEARGAVRKTGSWLKTKTSSRKHMCILQNPISPPAEASNSATSVPEDAMSLVPSEPPPRYSLQEKPLTPEQYYTEEYGYQDEQQQPQSQQPVVEVVNRATVSQESAPPLSLPPPPISIPRQADFKPNAVAMQRAARCAQNATAALNFSDAEHAIQCLQAALKCLTQPSTDSLP